MDALELAIKQVIETSTIKIADIVKSEHPLILSRLAKNIFDSVGQTHDRKWQSNAPSTIRKKKFDKRNFETGELMNTLMEVGFLEDDNYMENLPTPQRGSSYGYKAANAVNSPENRFDDIGRTESDERYIGEQLAVKIGESFKEINNG